MKEIGGYIELDELKGEEYYTNLLALNTARNAVALLCKIYNINKLYLPIFLCNSFQVICERDNISYEYYHVGYDFMPNFDKDLKENERIVIVNYYGQLTNEIEKKLFKKYGGRIIWDNVQAFYDRPLKCIDTIYSCRKFFGVPDGAYLSLALSIESLPPLNNDISNDRMRCILGRYEGLASNFYNDFKDNSEIFKNLSIKKMSKLTHNLLRAIDYRKIKRKREENWSYLHTNLRKKNKLSLIKPIGAFMYPFYTGVDNGKDIRKQLAEKKIYIPTLWPTVQKIDNCQIEQDMANNILPLPIDQRYDTNDMNIILAELEKIY